LRVDSSDLIAGCLVIALGAAFLVGAEGMRFGTARNIGPGFFPRILSIGLIGLGASMVLSAFFRSAPLPVIAWRPMLLVGGAITGFGITMYLFGMVPAIIVTVLVASLAEGAPRLSSLIAAIVMTVAIWLVFIVGLGLRIPVFRSPLG